MGQSYYLFYFFFWHTSKVYFCGNFPVHWDKGFPIDLSVHFSSFLAVKLLLLLWVLPPQSLSRLLFQVCKEQHNNEL